MKPLEIIIWCSLALLPILVLFAIWGRRCTKCASVWNWIHYRKNLDEHKNIMYENYYTKCAHCGCEIHGTQQRYKR